MLAIEMSEGDRSIGEDLQKLSPESVTILDGRAIDGTFGTWTLFLSAAALAVPAIQKIVVALIEAKKHRRVSVDGCEYRGYSVDEVKSLMKQAEKMKDKS